MELFRVALCSGAVSLWAGRPSPPRRLRQCPAAAGRRPLRRSTAAGRASGPRRRRRRGRPSATAAAASVEPACVAVLDPGPASSAVTNLGRACGYFRERPAVGGGRGARAARCDE